MQFTAKEKTEKTALLKSYLNKLTDIIFPPRCFSCSELVNKMGGLCPECWKKINFITKPYCHICSHPFEYDFGTNALCINCAAEKPIYDKAISVFRYDDSSRHLITSYKYSDKIIATDTYSRWLIKNGNELFSDTDYIIPVPIHWKRMLSRKYNQSALLANAVSKITGKPVIPAMLKRVKFTPAQASLSKKERLTNIKGAFGFDEKYKKMVAGKNVLIIDDVMTTGATISECSKHLRKMAHQKYSY